MANETTASNVSPRSRSEKRLNLFFYLLTGYILLQFAWWAYLLVDLNTKYYRAEGSETVKIKVLMVVGEGSVFLLFLLIGIFIMQRTIRKEIQLVRQQRNFLLSITHELKTPVAAIKLCLQTLQKRTGLSAAQREPLQNTAVENTERLHNLIDNVLLATRIESGQHMLQIEQTNLSELTYKVLTSLRNTVAGTVSIDTDIEEGLQGAVDEMAYESILINLLENAVKYASGSPIRVQLRRVNASTELQVADQGPGIPKQEKGRIFEKFYRMGNEETRTKKGTGLGLYIVKHLADLHGAHIWVSDGPKGGTIFHVRFK